jgi:hypothetical protein
MASNAQAVGEGRESRRCMTEVRTIVGNTSIDNPDELEKRAREAAHVKFAQWHQEEREQRPRRILMFALGAVVIVVATVLLMLTHGA